jgi:hypothetical protein
MAEMKNEKDKKSDEDIKFSREELVSDDLREAEFAREKRNKAMPEQYRDDPSKLIGWPPPEDKLPAVMPADKESDHDYKQETYDKVDQDLRDQELRGQPGDVARAELSKSMAKAIAVGESTNDIQAPPSPNAVIAAEGGGAQNTPLPSATPAATRTTAAPAPKPAAKSNNK